MLNAFMVYGITGVNVQIKKLKGILMWKLWMLEHVGIVSLCGYLMTLGNGPRRNGCHLGNVPLQGIQGKEEPE